MTKKIPKKKKVSDLHPPDRRPLSSQGRGKRGRVLMALSGGIDSAVSAYLLLKQGYEVEAAFMKNWSSTKGLKYNECPWLVDRQDALRVAAFLKIPLHTLDFEKEYEQNVLEYFFKEYEAGRTPNPDVMCNKEIKFKLLYDWAMEHGFDYLATGHYARIGKRVEGGRSIESTFIPQPFILLRSKDEFKDQTYFIYNIKTEQLPHVLFPIGGMKKSQVRAVARKAGLPNAEKKESMGLCFVGKIRLKDFLEQKLKPKPGPIVLVPSGGYGQGCDSLRVGREAVVPRGHRATGSPSESSAIVLHEQVIGEHQGLHNYTIGQRQGVKVGASGPYYVIRKDLETNTLRVTNDPNDKNLETKEIEIHSANWIDQSYQLPATSYRLLGRFRHQGELVPLTVTRVSDDRYCVTFKRPQKAVASGQSLVLYKGKVCVGGGVIV